MSSEVDTRRVSVQEKGRRLVSDRRTRRTQASLQQALRNLILEKSYDTITIEDITNRADVGRSTFYLHFKGKDDLFRWSFEQLYDELLSQLAAARQRGNGGLSFLSHLLEHVENHRIVYRALAGTRARSIVAVQVRRLLLDLCSQYVREQPASDLPRDLVTRSLSGFLDALILGWVEGAMTVPADQIEAFARRVAIGALGSTTDGDAAPP
jgi:AcrR family transcriptional regulator